MRALSIIVIGLGAAAVFGACGGNDAASPPASSDAGDAAPPEAGLPPLEAQPPEPVAAANRHDAASSPVVFDGLRGGVWTANGDVGSLSYVDVDARKVVQEISIGKDIRSIALSPDARWIAAVDRTGAQVTLVDAETRRVLRAIPLGTHPRAAVWDAYDPRWLYVALEDDNAIAIVDRTLGVVSRTVSVGRLPSGLAVSRQRRELYVTHRIDGRVTILPLDGVYSPGDQGVPPIELSLADEPDTGDPKVPHGKPFGFESLALAPDGNVAWVPHELFAPTHPFQFQSTLFPTISVADLSLRAEVQTDPADPNGVIAGRKNLFRALNILDETGNTSVLSQPCAVAFHPNGLVAYALACASEDLVTFDLTQGIAVGILRNLPGDHPVGLSLDDTGQRAFVVSDQSHSLVVLDTAGGSLLGHPRVLGTPIALAARDPVDPDLRQGLTLFYRASSGKGDTATTGNNWMSCGGCHLDGFVSTNQAFFDDGHVVDTTKNANVGHEGLADLFSTSPTPGDPSFNPHDVLVAFLDQGGLAPDRTGAVRTGAIDPSAPSAAAKTMAAQVAHVIARDLPLGPSWLLAGSTPPVTAYDGAWCGNCHQAQYAAWQKSAHAHAAEDPMMLFGAQVEQKDVGPQYSRQCAGCHDPVTARTGDTSLTSKRGITCLGCHDVDRLIRAGGNADLEAPGHDWTQDHKARGIASLERLRDPQFCGGCHQQFTPGGGLQAITTLGEWQHSIYSGAPAGDADAGEAGAPGTVTICVDCHATKDANGVADHLMIGGNVYMATKFGDADMVTREQSNLKAALGLEAKRDGANVQVVVHNRGAGHGFPTGVTDVREPWVELQAVDASKNVIARYGGLDATGLLPSSAARFGIDIAKPDGTVLLLHELSQSSRIPFDRRVPAAGSTTVTIAAPKSLPAGATELDAVLLYRNVRTTYYRAATGDAQGSSPTIEVNRTVVP